MESIIAARELLRLGRQLPELRTENESLEYRSVHGAWTALGH